MDTAVPGLMATPLRLKPTEPLETGVRRLAIECIDTALQALDEPDGRDEAIHTVRKQCKQARALLRLFHFGLGDTCQRELAFFRDIGRSLSVARDLRVVLDLHDSLIEEFGTALDRSVGAVMRQDLIASYRSIVSGAGTGAGSVMDNEELRSRMRTVRSRARRWHLQTGADDVIRRGIVRSYRRARRALRRAETTQLANNFHEARKRAKDFLYQLEILSGRYAHVVSERIDAATRLTDVLGDAHDLEVYRLAIQRAASGRCSDAVELLSLELERRGRVLHARATELGQMMFGAKPAEFAALLEEAADFIDVGSGIVPVGSSGPLDPQLA